jgi:hypothetical protein
MSELFRLYEMLTSLSESLYNDYMAPLHRTSPCGNYTCQNNRTVSQTQAGNGRVRNAAAELPLIRTY